MDFVIPIWVAQKTSSRKYDTIFFLTFFAYFPLFVLWFFNAIEFLINRIFCLNSNGAPSNNLLWAKRVTSETE